MSRLMCNVVVLAMLLGAAWAQSEPPSQTPPRGDASGSSTGESSSKDTKVDLSPPPGEEGLDLRGADTSGDMRELTPWDPHKADKNVEVGDYYFRKKNYTAAISRYREALYWKSNDATATLRLAQALEQVGQYREARSNYQAYLKILPNGEFADKAASAVERLKDKPDDPGKLPGAPTL